MYDHEYAEWRRDVATMSEMERADLEPPTLAELTDRPEENCE